MNKCRYLLPCGRCDKFNKKCKAKKYCMYPNGLEPIMNPPKFMNNPMDMIKCKPLPTYIRDK